MSGGGRQQGMRHGPYRDFSIRQTLYLVHTCVACPKCVRTRTCTSINIYIYILTGSRSISLVTSTTSRSDFSLISCLPIPLSLVTHYWYEYLHGHVITGEAKHSNRSCYADLQFSGTVKTIVNLHSMPDLLLCLLASSLHVIPLQ